MGNPWPEIIVTPMRVINESGLPLQFATEGSIGLDLHALEGFLLAPGQRRSVDTGITIELPPYTGALVLPRSGLARQHGVLCVTGVIDRDYRGRLGVTLCNTGVDSYKIAKGDRIAQLVLISVPHIHIEEVTELTTTERGAGGFGSTGR